MKRAAVFVLLILTANFAFSTSLGPLEGIFKPQMIKVFDDELFVVEGHKVFIYSLKDLSLKRKIGKEGEGPGEFNLDPNRTAIITVSSEYIIIESRFKIVYFARDGRFVKETRKAPGVLQTVPIGKNYLVYKILYGPKNENYVTLNIYNGEMKPVKEIYRQKFFSYKGRSYVMPDPLNYCIHDGKIYVEASPEGFVVEVFDFEGKPLDQFQKEYEKITVTAAHRENALDHFLGIAQLQRAIKERGRAAVVSEVKSQGLAYADYFPAVQDIKTDGNNLYLRTYHRKKDKEKYMVTDLKGKVRKDVYLPIPKKADFFVLLQGDKKYYDFFNNTFYYLKYVETDDDESWEVHVEKIE